MEKKSRAKAQRRKGRRKELTDLSVLLCAFAPLREKYFYLAVILVGLIIVGLPLGHAQTQPPYKNPNLPIEARVNDLVSRMTLEEKVSQMQNGAPAIERLGIPAYDWWNEALHGVARAGYATVFPQATGLAATWDTKLIHDVADVISTEARAKHHEAIRNNQHGRYQGLTFWSPNINIFRDPRWGRGQETYGEDPYLTARLGVEFVRGLQGNDPRYFKVIATPKHYAVHSGPEPERHSFDAQAYERDLRETYLPAFHDTIVEAKAYSIMCAYNRTNGEPCCANKKLMMDILRGEWGFDGYVVSDCGAIRDIWEYHKFVKTEAESSALAVRAGTDLTCGNEYVKLLEALQKGLITEAEIDTSLKRLLTARFRLGMFDTPEMVPYARIPFSQNDTAEHRQLALKTARESIVLLKNANRTLPLKKDLKSIAVIGPNADAPEVLWGNYYGYPSRLITPLAGIRNAVSANTKVSFALGSTLAGEPVVTVPMSVLSINGKGTQPGLKAEYFNNPKLEGQPATVRTDERIDFNWGRFKPTPQVNENNFSVRWIGKLTPVESGTYTLGFTADDGARLYLDGKLIADAWTGNPTRTLTKEVTLEAGRNYDLLMEYFQTSREAVAKLVWSYPRLEERLIDEAVSAAKNADATVLVLGISAGLEGEEMPVKVEGFRGGDRTDLALPKPQEALLKAVVATGKPVVVILLSGSALAVNWANDNVPAILHAWYPGGEGGTAVADVLFGEYNPAGRLPVTFYKSVDQLPPFTDYSMQGRTYRYFKGEPLYPFGFGLSYTNFVYSNLRVDGKSVKAGESIKVTVDVKNVGDRAGDEVVQLYLTDVAASVPVPIRSLIGFDRVSLKAGEKRSVTFTIKSRQMSVIDDAGKRVIEPGEFLVNAGGGQPGFKGTPVLTGKFSVSGTLELKER
ncbi:MAG TPA: glycoside hydrolase family 3 C-terminal domain-containing protein [Pyrinomonadaceae bacterium]|nr:glycoside hydrolase family 3 C-terminal domain-containing protein [Pyrinomonadaceae bacterium]